MNAWDVDPNLQLSTYTQIGHGITMFFNKLTKQIGKRISRRGRQVKVSTLQVTEIQQRDDMRHCCITAFKELAENHRLYYPTPHVF